MCHKYWNVIIINFNVLPPNLACGIVSIVNWLIWRAFISFLCNYHLFFFFFERLIIIICPQRGVIIYLIFLSPSLSLLFIFLPSNNRCRRKNKQHKNVRGIFGVSDLKVSFQLSLSHQSSGSHAVQICSI